MNRTAAERQRLLDFFYKSGVTHLDFAILSAAAAETPLMREFGGIPKLKSEAIIRYAGYANMNESGNIFVRPARKLEGVFLDHPILFLDDVPENAIDAICDYWSVAVVETSRGSYQVWIRTRWPLDEKSRARAQSGLALEFNTDRASVSGEHYGRLPGFRNRKPTRNNAWINVVKISGGALLDPTPYLRNPREEKLPLKNASNSSRATNGVDPSAAEFGFALNALKNGTDPETVRNNLLSRAILRRSPADARRYVDYTIRKCLNLIGPQ